MVRASISLTHNSIDRKGCFVTDGVIVGWVGVREWVTVTVGERVAVCEAVGVSVSASLVRVTVSGMLRVAVARTLVGACVGVGVITSGSRTNVEMAASRKPSPRMMGTKYLRSMRGNAAVVVTGGSPV